MKKSLFIFFIILIVSIISAFAEDIDSTYNKPKTENLGRGKEVAKWLQEKGLSPELIIILIATLPIIELRGAIPVAMHTFKMSIPKSYILSVIGNMLPIPFIILLLGPISRLLRKIKIFDRFFAWLFARTMRRSETIKKYEELGLIIFIAIPLPATGAWTGSIAAFLLGLRFLPSFLCALAGVCIAGVIVTTFSAFGFIGAISAAIILFCISAFSIFKKNRKKAK